MGGTVAAMATGAMPPPPPAHTAPSRGPWAFKEPPVVATCSPSLSPPDSFAHLPLVSSFFPLTSSSITAGLPSSLLAFRSSPRRSKTIGSFAASSSPSPCKESSRGRSNRCRRPFPPRLGRPTAAAAVTIPADYVHPATNRGVQKHRTEACFLHHRRTHAGRLGIERFVLARARSPPRRSSLPSSTISGRRGRPRLLLATPTSSW